MVSTELEQQQLVAGVRFTKVGKLYHFDYSEFSDLKGGDYVIVETARGRHMGQVMGFTPAEPDAREYRPILRPATARDMALRQHWESMQDEALEICKKKASDIGAFNEVKFVAAQYNYDGSMLTFLFTAEQKINVGKLWGALKREFDCQIEMRQIGPRDVAKLLGGYGACGELRCCSTFLTDFSPISIKMAKVQGISLNPSEITGMCGRLRCCLVYEYEQYVEARKKLPKRNKRIGTPLGPGKVIDVQPLADLVTVYIEEEGRRTFKREELIPLDELEALQKKAQEPCSKHGEDEPCSCGQKPGNRNQDNVTGNTDES
jgi:cell fate regulator YaaT (PSP1 superfamily)